MQTAIWSHRWELCVSEDHQRKSHSDKCDILFPGGATFLTHPNHHTYRESTSAFLYFSHLFHKLATRDAYFVGIPTFIPNMHNFTGFKLFICLRHCKDQLQPLYPVIGNTYRFKGHSSTPEQFWYKPIVSSFCIWTPCIACLNCTQKWSFIWERDSFLLTSLF